MKKVLAVLALCLVSLISLSAFGVAAVEDTLSIVEIEVDGVDVTAQSLNEADANVDGEGVTGLIVQEGDTIDIEVLVESTGHNERVQVEAEIFGYEYSDYEGEELWTRTHVDDIRGTPENPERQKIDLQMKLPNRLPSERYLLKIEVSNGKSSGISRWVTLRIDPTRHGVEIADVAFSPGMTVQAGRSLLVDVLLENYGQKDEKDVKVTAAIPALGVQDSEVVSDVETDDENVDYEDVEGLFLQIPPTAAAGTYQVVVTARYDDLRETTTQTFNIEVVENPLFKTSNKLILAVGPEVQTVPAGSQAVYGVALTNAGRESKAYILDVASTEAISVSLSENLVVLAPGQNKVVKVTANVDEKATLGEHTINIGVRSGETQLETVPLRANVVAGNASSSVGLRGGIEIALIVIIVLIVIVALIIGFTRLRKDDEEEEQTYY